MVSCCCTKAVATPVSADCVVCLFEDSLSFEEAAKLLSKTGSTNFPGTGDAIGYAAKDASGKLLSLACIVAFSE